MTIENKEIIFFETSKSLKFIGRVLYHLKDFLILHFKDESEKFIRNKFYVNGEPLSAAFFRNHVYAKPDLETQPDIGNIDAFFEKQKSIFLKNTI